MGKSNKNKNATRCIVAAGTLLAGIGIWASVNNYPQFSATGQGSEAMVSTAPGTGVSPSVSNVVVNPPVIQNVPVTAPQNAPVQPSPVQSNMIVTPTPAPVQSAPTTTPSAPKPTPVVTPAPVQSAPAPAPAPRLRTRGS